VSFSYTFINEDSAGGGDFAKKLSLLILKKKVFQVKFAILEHGSVASSKSLRMWVWLIEECGCGWLKEYG